MGVFSKKAIIPVLLFPKSWRGFGLNPRMMEIQENLYLWLWGEVDYLNGAACIPISRLIRGLGVRDYIHWEYGQHI